MREPPSPEPPSVASATPGTELGRSAGEGPSADASKERTGLTSLDAAARLVSTGPNEIAREEASSPWKLLASQFASPVIWLLVGACAVSAALGETADAIAIGVIVMVNGLVGFFQEYRAERAVVALRSMTAPRARVLRDGRPAVIPAAQVVPADILLLEAGDLVAADATILEAHVLTVNEALLTGESAPVETTTERSAEFAARRHRRASASSLIFRPLATDDLRVAVQPAGRACRNHPGVADGSLRASP